MAGNDGACFHVERGNAWRVVLWPAPWLGPRGRMACHVLDECLRALVFIYRWKSEGWRKNNLLE